VTSIDYRKVLEFLDKETAVEETDGMFYNLLAHTIENSWGCESSLKIVRMFTHLLEIHGAKAGERFDDLIGNMRLNKNTRKRTFEGLMKRYAVIASDDDIETRFSPDVVRLVKKFCDLRPVFDRVDVSRFVSVAGKKEKTDRASGERVVDLTFRKPTLVPIKLLQTKKTRFDYFVVDDDDFVERIAELVGQEMGDDPICRDEITVCNYKDGKCFSLNTFEAEDTADLCYVAASSVKLYIECDTIRAKLFPDKIIDDLSYIGLTFEK
jgi:hypothetical protein